MMNIDLPKDIVRGDAGVASTLWPRLRRIAFVTWKAFVYFAPVVLTAIGMVLAWVAKVVVGGVLDGDSDQEYTSGADGGYNLSTGRWDHEPGYRDRYSGW